MIVFESIPWCSKYDHAIDDELVHKFHPECIEEHNGCGNCPRQTQQEILTMRGEQNERK